MPKIVILIGPPGSGKTSFTKQVFSTYTRISQDEMGKKEHFNIFQNALNNNQDIIIDRMNMSKQQRQRYLKPALERGYQALSYMFFVPKEICLMHCKERENHPTIKNEKDAGNALESFFKQFEYPTLEEGFSEILYQRWNYNAKQDAYICDLDGTLADIEHRRHYMTQEKKDWKNFFNEIPNDKLNLPVWKTVSFLRVYYPMIFVSGRPELYKEQTLNWLQNEAKMVSPTLFMRPRNDYRSDDLIKEIILDFELIPRYNIIGVFDDRQRVVDMFRRRELTVFQVAEGNF